MRDDYRCAITFAFCCRHKHYEDDCYCKRRLSAKMKSENSPNGGENSKGNGTRNTKAIQGPWQGPRPRQRGTWWSRQGEREEPDEPREIPQLYARKDKL